MISAYHQDYFKNTSPPNTHNFLTFIWSLVLNLHTNHGHCFHEQFHFSCSTGHCYFCLIWRGIYLYFCTIQSYLTSAYLYLHPPSTLQVGILAVRITKLPLHSLDYFFNLTSLFIKSSHCQPKIHSNQQYRQGLGCQSYSQELVE